jgi:hypothetical protein
MKVAYRVFAGLIALGVVVQAGAIAYAWFAAIHDIDSGTVIDENYEGNAGHALHGMNGMMVMPALALILLIISFFAKVSGGVKWAGLILLAVVLQVVLAFVSFGAPIVGALHGINALVILGLAGMAARRATATPTVTSATAAPAAPVTTV